MEAAATVPTTPAAPAVGTPEHDAAMVAKYDEGKTEPANEPAVAGAESRPEWLPEKFKSPEELSKAYAELEKKLGTPTKEPTTPDSNGSDTETDPAKALVTDAGLDFDLLSDEFAQSGELSTDSYTKLEAAGIPRDMVDSYIEGQMAIANNLRNEAFTVAGGETNYTAMVQWAAANMSAAEQAAFNTTVSSSSADQVKFAVAGLKARYEAVNGSSPDLTGGEGSTSGAEVFESWAQVKEAMKDPRYAKDPAYRGRVEQKLGRSNPV